MTGKLLGWLGLGVIALGCGARTELQDSQGGAPGIASCEAFSTGRAQAAPLDLHLVLDSSGSMADFTENDTEKWAEIALALEQFMTDPRSESMSVALTFFPEHEGAAGAFWCDKDSDCAGGGVCAPLRRCEENLSVSCQDDKDCEAEGVEGACISLGSCEKFSQFCKLGGPEDTCIFPSLEGSQGPCLPRGVCSGQNACQAEIYQTPATKAESLPSGLVALQQAMLSRVVSGGTPMLPALTGALRQARSRFAEGGSRVPIVVLATDGEPSICSLARSLEGAVEEVTLEAQRGTSAGVSTFVIGVFAKDQQEYAQEFLDQIATAGGTEKAYVVASDGKLASELFQVLGKIRQEGARCNYALPESSTAIRPEQVAVTVALGGPPGALNHVPGGLCGPEGGYFFDSDLVEGAPPRRVILCPKTCGEVSLASGEVSIRASCGE
jgi:hypothetical protein